MCLGDDITGVTQQTIIKSLPRIIVRTHRGNLVDGRSRGSRGTHQAIKLPGVAVSEMQVPQEQVFVQVPRRQSVLVIFPVEKTLPLADLGQDPGRGFGQARHRRTLRQPLYQNGVLLVGQVRHGKGHALARKFARVLVKTVDGRAGLGATQRQVYMRRQHAETGLGIELLEAQHLVHHRLVKVDLRQIILLVDDSVKTTFAPLGVGFGIDIQARRRHGRESCPVVYFLRAGAACNTGRRRKLELTGCVIAAVANHAAPLQDRPDLLLV